jgi:hypothetical protein
MPSMATESHVRQHKAMEEWQQKAMYLNRKPCVAKESLCSNRKLCVANRKQERRLLQQTALCGKRSHVWQQKAIGVNRKSWVATESHGWQRKAMGGNRKQPCVAIGSLLNATRKPTFLPSEANFSMWHERQPARSARFVVIISNSEHLKIKHSSVTWKLFDNEHQG